MSEDAKHPLDDTKERFPLGFVLINGVPHGIKYSGEGKKGNKTYIAHPLRVHAPTDRDNALNAGHAPGIDHRP